MMSNVYQCDFCKVEMRTWSHVPGYYQINETLRIFAPVRQFGAKAASGSASQKPFLNPTLPYKKFRDAMRARPREKK